MSELIPANRSQGVQSLAVVLLGEEKNSLPLQGIPWQRFTQDIFSKPLAIELAWALVWTKRDLLFASKWPIELEGLIAEKGSFVEGLWKENCAEFFLLNPQTQEYWEFNLTAHGAWWGCAFSAPRQRRQEKPEPLPGVQVSCYQKADYQLSVLRIPRVHFKHWFAGSSTEELAWRGNVTACLGKPQQFASVATLGAQQPDFHRPEDFLPLQMSVMG